MRSHKEIEYQMLALKWRQRARLRSLMLYVLTWIGFAGFMWLNGFGAAFVIAGASGALAIILKTSKYLLERKDYQGKIVEHNLLKERGAKDGNV